MLIAACLINVCIGTSYAWSMFRGPLLEAVNPESGLIPYAFTVASGIAPIPMVAGGALTRKFGPGKVVLGGGILFGGGVLLTGFASSDMIVIIGYGILMGLGMGFVYGCTITNTIKFFPDKAGLVGGLTTATYGLGSVILPLIVSGIDGSNVLSYFKVLGIVYLVVITIGSFFIKPCPDGFKPEGWIPPAPKAGVKAPESKNWKQMLADPVFWVMLILMICGALLGLMMISGCRTIVGDTFASEANIAAIATISVTILALFNALGRVACGAISDKLGRINTLLMMLVVGVVGLVVITMAPTSVVCIAGICLVGLAFGAFMGVYPGFTAEQFGPANNGVNYGIMFVGFALAGIFGPMFYQNFGTPTCYYLAIALGVLGLVLCFVYKAMNRAK